MARKFSCKFPEFFCRRFAEDLLKGFLKGLCELEMPSLAMPFDGDSNLLGLCNRLGTLAIKRVSNMKITVAGSEYRSYNRCRGFK